MKFDLLCISLTHTVFGYLLQKTVLDLESCNLVFGL